VGWSSSNQLDAITRNRPLGRTRPRTPNASDTVIGDETIAIDSYPRLSAWLASLTGTIASCTARTTTAASATAAGCIGSGCSKTDAAGSTVRRIAIVNANAATATFHRRPRSTGAVYSSFRLAHTA
jgi:hypothetical protein